MEGGGHVHVSTSLPLAGCHPSQHASHNSIAPSLSLRTSQPLDSNKSYHLQNIRHCPCDLHWACSKPGQVNTVCGSPPCPQHLALGASLWMKQQVHTDNTCVCQASRHQPVTLARKRQMREKDHEFEASLGSTASSCLKSKTQKNAYVSLMADDIAQVHGSRQNIPPPHTVIKACHVARH